MNKEQFDKFLDIAMIQQERKYECIKLEDILKNKKLKAILLQAIQDMGLSDDSEDENDDDKS